MSLFSLLKEEAKEVVWVSLYFFFGFCVALTLKKLLLSNYYVDVNLLSTAAISALIVAKIVIVLDKMSVGCRFDESLPIGLAALYKTLFYVLATFVVLFLEKLFGVYQENSAFLRAVVAAWEHRDRNIILAKVLCIGLFFAAYHLYHGIDRRLGEGSLRRLIIGVGVGSMPFS
jgi:hypothetical protein